MKKYLVVAYDGYYPDADLENIRFQTDDYKQAEKIHNFIQKTRRYSHSSIVDRDEYDRYDSHTLNMYAIYAAKQAGAMELDCHTFMYGNIIYTRDEIVKLFGEL